MEKENKQRLIDVNAVIRKIQKAHKKIIEKYGSADGADIVIEVIVEFLKKAPSVDAVEVVRCKDCKWWKDFMCTNVNGADCLVMNENWFCASGERREGE